MANKKPTITLGKGTKYSASTRPVSPKPSDSSKLNAAKRTTSSGITIRPDGRAQSEGRSGRQSISKATVSNSGQNVTPGSAGGRVTTGQGKQQVTLPPVPPKPKPNAGTTYTVRATGGNSTDPKINRLSAPKPSMPKAPTPQAQRLENLAKSQKLLQSQLGPIASLASGAKSLAVQAVADSVMPRPVASGELVANQQRMAELLKKKKKRTT